MNARFRVRVVGGREFTIGTLEAFVRQVRSRDITPYDLVYDALTSEWAPARTHPAYRLSLDPLVTGLEDPEGQSDDVAVLDDGELKVDLVEVVAPSPEEEAAQFLAKMAEERRSEPGHLAIVSEVPLIDPRSGIIGGIVSMPERSPQEASVDSAPATAQVSSVRRAGAYEPRGSTSRGRGVRPALVAALVLVFAASASVAWPELHGGEAPSRPVASVTMPERNPRPVAASESEVRHAAYAEFIRRVDALRADRGVGRVPDAWLGGHYLANPSAYPEVGDYWERYLEFVEAARDGEADLYRDAYLAAAEAAGVRGPMRSLRMAGAAGDFQARRPARDARYQAVWKLAAAAVSLHARLISMEGRVSYEPARGSHLSADPVIEAAGVDQEAQRQLEEALDQVLDAMAPLQSGLVSHLGEGRVRIPGWLIGALRDAGDGVS